MQNHEKVKQATRFLEDRLPAGPRPAWALALGTGLGDGMAGLVREWSLSFEEIPGFPKASVPSHAGRLGLARLGGVAIWLQEGRLHLYEGHSPGEVALPLRTLAGLGARGMILTNAAGCLNPLWDAGDLMLVADQINRTGASPLAGPNVTAWGPRFPDMCDLYAPRWRAMALESARERGIRLHQGVYVGVRGPEMETPAETRLYRQAGADAIGMSTVLEAIAARHLGLELLGVSCLTNKNLPDCQAPASLESVIAVAREAAGGLERLLEGALPRLEAALAGR